MNNPRPPSGYFDQMRPAIIKQYPRRSKATQDRIIAGIFWKYPESKREEIINKFDRNPKIELLECPVCKHKNPVSRSGVYLKCGKCRRNLVSIKIRRK